MPSIIIKDTNILILDSGSLSALAKKLLLFLKLGLENSTKSQLKKKKINGSCCKRAKKQIRNSLSLDKDPKITLSLLTDIKNDLKQAMLDKNHDVEIQLECFLLNSKI